MMRLIDRIANTNRLTAASAAEKMLFALGMLALAVGLPPWPGAVLVLIVVLAALFGGARIRLRDYAKVIGGPLVVLLVGLIPLFFSLSFGGPAFVRLGVSPTGPELALKVTLRVLAAVNCLLFLSLTTPLPQMLAVLHRLRVPAVITEVSLLVYRYVWVFIDAVVTMRRAQASRLGYSTTRRSFHSLAMLLAALLGQALNRGRALQYGMESRNWRGELRVLEDGARASALAATAIVGLEAAILAGVLVWTHA